MELSDELKERIQKAISKQPRPFHKDVYNHLQVVEIFGEPWHPNTREDLISVTLKDEDDWYVEKYPSWISENLHEYHKIYIRVTGGGSKYCHNYPGGIEHKHHCIYFIAERINLFEVSLYQCCFGNDLLYNKTPCKTPNPIKIFDFATFYHIAATPKYYPEKHDLLVSLFGKIDDGSDRVNPRVLSIIEAIHNDTYTEEMHNAMYKRENDTTTSTTTTDTTTGCHYYCY